jgi:hypothetical protein
MFGFKKAAPTQSQEQQRQAEVFKRGQEFAVAWADEIKQRCNAHLLQVATSEHHHEWDEAERMGDLQKVIMLYCAAVSGTEEVANNMFKQFEEKAEELDLLIEYTKIRKLQHLMQLRTFFEYKLKLNLVPAGADRERLRTQVVPILDPELSEQF